MINIRQNLFETNSSSVHTITICSENDFDRWKTGELIWNNDTEKFEKSDSPEVRKAKEEYANDERYYNPYYTYEDFFDSYDRDLEYMETYESYQTIGKEKVVAFGYYGQD